MKYIAKFDGENSYIYEIQILKVAPGDSTLYKVKYIKKIFDSNFDLTGSEHIWNENLIYDDLSKIFNKLRHELNPYDIIKGIFK